MCQRLGECKTYTYIREMETVELTCVSERGRLQQRETARVTRVLDRGNLRDVHVRQRQRRCVEPNDEFVEPPYSNSIL